MTGRKEEGEDDGIRRRRRATNKRKPMSGGFVRYVRTNKC
jgi:hypothetical protein